MSGVFLDTVGLIAVWDTTDQWHDVAEVVFQELLHKRIPLVTTSQVLLECGNAASRRPYRYRANALRKQLRDAGLLADPSDEELENAWLAFDGGEAAGAGIVDQISFVIMNRRGIRRAFTNDEHFRAAGFETLF
jgi:predicted nucleic acid-binding protein